MKKLKRWAVGPLLVNHLSIMHCTIFFEYRSISLGIRRHPSHCISLTPFSHGNLHRISFLSLSNRLPGSNTFYWDGLLRLFPNSQIGNGGKYDHQTIGIKPYNIDQTDLCCFEIGSNIGSRKRVRKRLASRTAGWSVMFLGVVLFVYCI